MATAEFPNQTGIRIISKMTLQVHKQVGYRQRKCSELLVV